MTNLYCQHKTTSLLLIKSFCESHELSCTSVNGIYLYMYLCMHFSVGNDLPKIPDATNNSVVITENSKYTFNLTIKYDRFDSQITWCFEPLIHSGVIQSDYNNSCCTCNSDGCPMPGWKLYDSFNCDDCQYTCSLTIHDVQMNYSNGVLVSTAKTDSGSRKIVNRTRIIVVASSDSKNPSSTLWIISGVSVVVAVISIAMCAVYAIIRKFRSSHSIFRQEYEPIPPCKYDMHTYTCSLTADPLHCYHNNVLPIKYANSHCRI